MGAYDSMKNQGWRNRRCRFMQSDKNGSETSAFKYRDDATTFIGRLHTQMEHCKQGLIPNQGWAIVIEFAKSDFMIHVPPDTRQTDKYQFHIEECVLYVPVAKLNAEISRSISQSLEKVIKHAL